MNPLHTALVGLLNADGGTEIVGLFHQDAALMKDLANSIAYTRKAQHALAVSHSKRLVPKAEPDKRHYRWSFWGQFEEKLIMRRAFCGSPEKQQELQRWLSNQKAKAKAWPPRVMTSVPFTVLPQPRDGRE